MIFGIPSIDVFHVLVWGHILFGAPGLLIFWVPVGGKKGGKVHVKWGRAFTVTMLLTASCATLISLTTLYDPVGTHPHLMHHEQFGDHGSIRLVFGWLMIYLAILTWNLTWHGWLVAQNKNKRDANRTPLNIGLQWLLLAVTVNCVIHGILSGQVLMIGISTIGFATFATNMWFLYKPKVGPKDWLLEHIKALIGTGISVYTAFFAFGAVRILPEAALTPALWSVPLIVGLSLIFYHWYRVKNPKKKVKRQRPQAAAADAGGLPPIQPAE